MLLKGISLGLLNLFYLYLYFKYTDIFTGKRKSSCGKSSFENNSR